MNALTLHLLCATVAAARAIGAAQKVAYSLDTEAVCGEWKGVWHIGRGFPGFVGVSSLDDPTNPPASFDGQWEDLDEPLGALTGSRIPKWGIADWAGSRPFSDANVLGAIATVEASFLVRLPLDFDWRTWAPEGVPA